MKNNSLWSLNFESARLRIKNMLFLLFILIFITLSTFSCKKTGSADARIHVIDSNRKSVSGATVVLRQDTVTNTTTGVKANIYQKKITDSEGNAFFSFQWEAVLNVEAKKGVDSASDYIRLEQSATVEKEIKLK